MAYKDFLIFGLCTMMAATPVAAQSFAKPEVISFGAGAAEMRAALEDKCATQETRKIAPPFLPNIETEQLQIDCDGFLFFGKPRRAEFVIGDDSLEMVWILTEAKEEAALRAAMTKAYGAPALVSDDMELFTEARAGLRKDIPEILFYSDALAPAMEAFHGGQ
ncbi:MAG: hypothetical protein ACX939_01850 [Hyphococcus sp.]